MPTVRLLRVDEIDSESDPKVLALGVDNALVREEADQQLNFFVALDGRRFEVPGNREMTLQLPGCGRRNAVA